MKTIKLVFPIIGLLLFGSGISIFAFTTNEYKESNVPAPYTIKVELPDCQDIECLDGCGTIDVVIWYLDNGVPRELGRSDYDGSCIYNFNIDVPANTTIFGNLADQSSCGVTCSTGQCTPPNTITISLYPSCN